MSKMTLVKNINTCALNKFDNDNEEYKGISYITGSGSDLTEVTDTNKKKSIDGDFRVKYKTEICKFWELNKICRYGENCAFAHGYKDIRTKVSLTSNYKTKKCKQFYESAYCPYGSRCQFLHSQQANSTTKTHSDPFFSYKKTIQKLLELDQIADRNLIKVNLTARRSRLCAFSSLTLSTNTEKSFYDDIFDLTASRSVPIFDMSYLSSSSEDSASKSNASAEDSRSRFMTV